MFAYNAWYVAAWSHEIADRPLGRTLLGEPIVLFRVRDGSMAALEDRCCHRGMPLAQGTVVAQGLQCGYHGLVFDASGRCVAIPTQDTIPAKARVRSFPVHEQDALVWVWMGDAAKAEPAEVPSYPYHNTWPHKVKTERLHCNYTLISDNLLDQSHAAYVHKSTLASDVNAYARVEMKTTPTQNGVRFIR